MRLKLYQLQVLAGVLVAALMEGKSLVSGHALAGGIADLLEAVSFLLCCAGVVIGARDLRSGFDAFGRDKTVARRDPAYMRARAQLQITSVAAVAAIGVLAARRYSVSDVVPLVAAAALGISLPLVNHLSGWTEHN